MLEKTYNRNMSVLEMHYIPDPVLRQKAKKIRDFKSQELSRLAQDMVTPCITTMELDWLLIK